MNNNYFKVGSHVDPWNFFPFNDASPESVQAAVDRAFARQRDLQRQGASGRARQAKQVTDELGRLDPPLGGDEEELTPDTLPDPSREHDDSAIEPKNPEDYTMPPVEPAGKLSAEMLRAMQVLESRNPLDSSPKTLRELKAAAKEADVSFSTAYRASTELFRVPGTQITAWRSYPGMPSDVQVIGRGR